MKFWNKKSQEEIKEVVFSALAQNVNYTSQTVLGIPASNLDDKVFNQDASFVKDAPFMSTLIQNPNHIGCHTLGRSESFFAGTQNIERHLIDICAVDILKGNIGEQDGYVASGGTEANIQALWIYRNYFMAKQAAQRTDICIMCSTDSHYSMDKGANLLALDIYKIPVEKDSRALSAQGIADTIRKAKADGKKHFIVVCNMMTTMFGSVDDVDLLVAGLQGEACSFRLHVDGAYGGFYYPFTDENSKLTFANEHICSFTLDAHKMAQAPYGTGIFLIRKGNIQYVNTQEASYVEGEDYTLIGSRSGANAVAAWMILVKNGPFGWYEKIFVLQKRTEWMCKQLSHLGIEYYRHPMANIITIKSNFVTAEVVSKFGLVPDNHGAAQWYKIVIMDHVNIEKLALLVADIKNAL
ncbi:MAG: aspartate aminotransferase family protein [Chitinophagaceae bacterium]|nr:aspartate aminotransferase family protein [Chitinophagaceae bacterium]